MRNRNTGKYSVKWDGTCKKAIITVRTKLGGEVVAKRMCSSILSAMEWINQQ